MPDPRRIWHRTPMLQVDQSTHRKRLQPRGTPSPFTHALRHRLSPKCPLKSAAERKPRESLESEVAPFFTGHFVVSIVGRRTSCSGFLCLLLAAAATTPPATAAASAASATSTHCRPCCDSQLCPTCGLLSLFLSASISLFLAPFAVTVLLAAEVSRFRRLEASSSVRYVPW